MEPQINSKVICKNSNPLPGNDIAPPLKTGEEYTVTEIHTCKCGKHHLNVGLPLEVNWVTCYDCNQKLPNHTHWSHPDRFVVVS